jgi:hypothetical protein
MIVIFGEKICVFLKSQCYEQIFEKKTSSSLEQRKRKFFSAKFFLKIITSVPD